MHTWLVAVDSAFSAFCARLVRLRWPVRLRWLARRARRRRAAIAAFHIAFVVATIGLSLVVATGLAVLVTALLALLVRPPWRSDGGTA
jgi:hypothetical protein